MFPESALLPLSALQHLLFCERQCALIHIERLWAENRLTVEGRFLHERADGKQVGPRGGGRSRASAGGGLPGHAALGSVRIVRALPIRSLRLGLNGKADVVEFRGAPPVPRPVEYKRGRPKAHRADEVQLCAQGLCLEEMLGLPAGGVPWGEIFYCRTRRRHEVEFDRELRALTESASARLHAMIGAGVTPRAIREKKCDRCSLLHLCLPAGTGPGRSVTRYIARVLADAQAAA